MKEAEKVATELGRNRGWEHASYVDAYGGTMRPEENEIEIPYYAEGVETFYTSAYLEGIEDYLSEHETDDEYEDPRENQWCGID